MWKIRADSEPLLSTPSSCLRAAETNGWKPSLNPGLTNHGVTACLHLLVNSFSRQNHRPVSLPPCQCVHPGGLTAAPGRLQPPAQLRQEKGWWPGLGACVRTAASPGGRGGAQLPGWSGRMKSELWREIYCTIKEECPALGTIKATLLWNYRGRLGN